MLDHYGYAPDGSKIGRPKLAWTTDQTGFKLETNAATFTLSRVGIPYERDRWRWVFEVWVGDEIVPRDKLEFCEESKDDQRALDVASAQAFAFLSS